MNRFLILSAQTPLLLSRLVEDHLNKGWQAHGNPFVFHESLCFGDRYKSEPTICQAVRGDANVIDMYVIKGNS